MYGGTIAGIKGHNWAGIDAQLTLIRHKSQWAQLAVAQTKEYTTDLLTKGDLLRPVRIWLTKLDEQTGLIRLEDNISVEKPKQQLQQISQTFKIGYFTYNCLENELTLSPNLEELLELEQTADTVVMLEKLASRVN